MLVQWVYGAFLVAYGLMHVAWIAPNPSRRPDWPFALTERPLAKGLLAPETARTLGITASIVATICFVVAGVVVVVGAPLQPIVARTALIVGAMSSTDVTSLFWDRRFTPVIAINALLALSGITGWPFL